MADLTSDPLPPQVVTRINKFVSDSIQSQLPEAIHRALHDQGLDHVTASLVRDLAVRTSDSKSEVLWKALRLYGIALDALDMNNHLAVLNPDDEIIHEIVGFEPAQA